MLTGQSLEKLDHKLARVFFSNQLIDERQDLGYGPGHYLRLGQVAELHHEISLITKKTLKLQ